MLAVCPLARFCLVLDYVGTIGKVTVEEANRRILILLDQLNLLNAAILNDIGLLSQLRDLHAIDRISNINTMFKYKPRNMNETVRRALSCFAL